MREPIEVPGGSQVSVPLTITLEVPWVMVDGERALVKVHEVVVCVAVPTVNAVLIMLLLGFGSLFVEADQINVCVPGHAVHGVCAVTVTGTPMGPR